MSAQQFCFNPARSQIPDTAPHVRPVAPIHALQGIVDAWNAKANIIREQSRQTAGGHAYAKALLTESLVLAECAYDLQRMIDALKY